MFHSARIKLTAWYLLIIMVISISFSTFIYFGATGELSRVVRLEQYRSQRPLIGIIPLPPPDLDNVPQIKQPDIQVINAEKIRIIESLFVVNIFIFFASALAAYFLAGRTLEPIKEMVEEQNRFITDASHELNTPLTALKTSIEVNLRDKKFNMEKAKEVLSGNLDDVNNLQLLSDKLIKITQFEKPNGNFRFEKVSLAEVVDAALKKVSQQAKKKTIKIETTVPKLSISGDKTSLTEVFTILLDNAVKYSPDKTSVEVKAKRTDHKIKITVKDEGIGIAKEDLLHIFDRFYRADKSRSKQKVTGYGLGLSIAKRIVNLHNGTIAVDSNPEKGTVFTMYFPAV